MSMVISQPSSYPAREQHWSRCLPSFPWLCASSCPTGCSFSTSFGGFLSASQHGHNMFSGYIHSLGPHLVLWLSITPICQGLPSYMSSPDITPRTPGSNIQHHTQSLFGGLLDTSTHHIPIWTCDFLPNFFLTLVNGITVHPPDPVKIWHYPSFLLYHRLCKFHLQNMFHIWSLLPVLS